MQKVRYLMGLALVMAASLYLLPALQAADEPVPDSPEVSELLTQAKSHALQLKDDSDLMHKWALMKLSWETHAAQITTIKDHVNKLGKALQQMDQRRKWASPWQKEAIDRITPLARELASNVENTIEHINNNQNRLHMPEFKDYLSANYELASSLSGLISDFVSYGKSKANYERLGSTLEVASQ
jgi:hypothetical protein